MTEDPAPYGANNEVLPESTDLQEVFMGTTSRAQTMADGSLRIQVDLAPADAIGAFTRFGTPGSAIAVARLADAVAVEQSRPTAGAHQSLYGQFAKDLKLSGFFRTPAVWEAIGTDAQYLAWVKLQPSALSGKFSEYHDNGDKYCIPAHVRRVEHGAGTGIKPPYSAIPLTNDEHQQAHQEGDNSIGSNPWWEKKRIKYVQDWAWQALKEQLFYDSWSMVPPTELAKWANDKGVYRYLPLNYKEAHFKSELGDK